jgi:hypothetical protein
MNFKEYFSEAKIVSHGSGELFYKVDFSKIKANGMFGWGMFFAPVKYNSYVGENNYEYKAKLDLNKNNTLNTYKALENQSEVVKNIISSNFPDLYEQLKACDAFYIYRAVGKGNPKESSKILSSLGIKGMVLPHDSKIDKVNKYTLIYCVFDPSVIHIVKVSKGGKEI